MDEDKIIVSDESNDRQYFSMLPHYILNHSTAIDQAVYMQMKRFAGENGEFYASKRTLLKKLGIGMKSLNKAITYLVEKKWIYEKGAKPIKTESGEQLIMAYGIVDIWKLNIDFYEKQGDDKRTGLFPGKHQGGVQRKSKVVSKEHQIRYNKINNINTATTSVAPSPFVLEEYLKKMSIDAQPHIKFLAFYIKKKGLMPKSVKEIGNIIGRFGKTAVKITETYSKGQISKAIDLCIEKHSDIDWGVETIYKKLTNNNL